MDKQNVAYIYNVIAFTLKKEGNADLGSIMMNLEDIMLSKISQSQKESVYDSICRRYTVKITETESSMVVVGDGMGSYFYWAQFQFYKKRVLKMYVVIDAQHYMCI
jgi:hypothetical protein